MFRPHQRGGTSSAAAAAYLVARHAAQPGTRHLRPAFEKGADTDTLAAMVGGLMGCLAGSEWLPSPGWGFRMPTISARWLPASLKARTGRTMFS